MTCAILLFAEFDSIYTIVFFIISKQWLLVISVCPVKIWNLVSCLDCPQSTFYLLSASMLRRRPALTKHTAAQQEIDWIPLTQIKYNIVRADPANLPAPSDCLPRNQLRIGSIASIHVPDRSFLAFLTAVLLQPISKNITDFQVTRQICLQNNKVKIPNERLRKRNKQKFM